MKKKLLITIATVMVLALSACGSSKESTSEAPAKDNQQAETAAAQAETSEAPAEPESESEATEAAAAVDLPTGQDIGTGSIVLSTPGGTSENGNVPKILEDSDTQFDSIGLNVNDFDRNHFSFVYINGVLNTKDQYGDTQTEITLSGDLLKAGTYTLAVVQYDGDAEGGEIITYKEATYEVVNE